MDFQFSRESLVEAKAGLLVVPCIQDTPPASLTELSQAADVDIWQYAKDENFKGAAGQTFLMRNLKNIGTHRVLLVGLGKDGEREIDAIQLSGATAMRRAKEVHAREVIIVSPETPRLAAQFIEGAMLGAYSFDRYVSPKPDDFQGFSALKVVGTDSLIEAAINQAVIIADGIKVARDLVNETPNVLTPEALADKARSVAGNHKFETHILGETELTQRGFNLIMAVGKGSDHPPRLAHLIYRPEGPVTRKVAFVGKGITFDTGGYNLKPGASMLGMHGDMAGAAAVIGAAHAIGSLKPEGIEIHFVLPMAENSISGRAMRPQDIIRGYGKKTVEIHNTDAEGRLVLADAIAYIQEHEVDTIIDLATLTGACVVALGEHTAGLFCNDDQLAASLLEASRDVGEDMWRMPLVRKLEKGIDTPTADMKNVGPRWGGAITAALFLQRFVTVDRWAHIDIAGPAWAEGDTTLSTAGGTGYGVATLVQFALNATKG